MPLLAYRGLDRPYNQHRQSTKGAHRDSHKATPGPHTA